MAFLFNDILDSFSDFYESQFYLGLLSAFRILNRFSYLNGHACFKWSAFFFQSSLVIGFTRIDLYLY